MSPTSETFPILVASTQRVGSRLGCGGDRRRQGSNQFRRFGSTRFNRKVNRGIHRDDRSDARARGLCRADRRFTFRPELGDEPPEHTKGSYASPGKYPLFVLYNPTPHRGNILTDFFFQTLKTIYSRHQAVSAAI